MNMTSKMFAIASLAMFAGCVMPRTSGVMVEKGRVAIEDPEFAANIEVVRDVMERNSRGFLHAQVALKNTNHTDYRCQYCMEWCDKNGMIQKHQSSPWTVREMHGRETVEIDEVSTLRDSEGFRLKIRRVD